MGVSVKGIYKEVANFYNQKVDPYVDRVKAGVIAGAKEVVNSYTGNASRDEVAVDVGAKALPAIPGAWRGYQEGKQTAQKAIESATNRIERVQAVRAETRIVVASTLKGAAKAVGWIGFIPDIYSFAKGFYQGYSNYGK